MVGPWALAGELANVTEPGQDTAVLRGSLCKMLLLPHQAALLPLAFSGTLNCQ